MELSLFAKGYLEGYINGASDHGGIVVHEDSVTLPDGVFYPSEKTVTRSLTKLDNLENTVIAGLRAIKEKQVSLGAEFVVLYGEEGQIEITRLRGLVSGAGDLGHKTEYVISAAEHGGIIIRPKDVEAPSV